MASTGAHPDTDTEREAGGRMAADGGHGRLDAEVVRAGPGGRLTLTGPPDGELLVYITVGSGRPEHDGPAEAVGAGTLARVPPGARRTLVAGPDGLELLSVRARTPAPDGGGEAACLLHRVCEECGRLAPGREDRYCARCGGPLPS